MWFWINVCMVLITFAFFLGSIAGDISFGLSMFVVIAWSIWLLTSTFRMIYLTDKKQKAARKNPYVYRQNQPQYQSHDDQQHQYNIIIQKPSIEQELLKEEEQKNQSADFISYKRQKVEDALFKRNYERAEAIIDEIVASADLKRDAFAVHYSLIKILDKLYGIREESPIVIDLCLKICDIDFSNMGNFILSSNEEIFSKGAVSSKRLISPVFLVTPTKAAIIFEKRGDIISAIKVCEMAIAWNAWDSGKKSFEERKARLEKKLQNQNTEQ